MPISQVAMNPTRAKDSPRYVFSIPLYDVSPASTESQVNQECKAFGSPVPFEILPVQEELSTRLSTGFKDDDDCETFLEEVVKITRHRTVSSEHNDDATNPSLQCSLCGTPTLERCLQCNWAPYCSNQCCNLHRPIHQFFCMPSYAQMYPRLAGLNVVPIHVAVSRIRRQVGTGTDDETGSNPKNIPVRGSARCNDTISSTKTRNTITNTAAPVLTESALIQRRARLILAHVRESGGKPVCAICGDPCLQSPSSAKLKSSPKQNTDTDGEEENASGKKYFSGDSKDNKGTPHRLVRFCGMLVCTTCVEIQATDML